MERHNHLKTMGKIVRETRKRNHMNQIDFYRELFPERELEEENIKKKMNAIENGKMKRVDIDLLLRLRDRFDVSLDYLFGFETEYPSYENKAASQYTGLSTEAVRQLRYWKRLKDKELPDLSAIEDNAVNRKHYYEGINKRNEAKWILYFASQLLGNRPENEEQEGVGDLPILHDLYMMSLEPQTIMGVPEMVSKSNLSLAEKIERTIKFDAAMVSYQDGAGGARRIDIAAINRQIWKEKLLQDVEALILDLQREDETVM